ncbi:MAG: hypothetical protein AAGF78_08665 [Pseudomonadota bacterium]
MRASQRAAHGAALLLVLTGAARACPLATDLAEGIAFVERKGALTLLRAAGEDVVAMKELDALGQSKRNGGHALYGLYPLSTQAEEAVFRFTWPEGLDTLPHPQLGLTVELPVIIGQDALTFPAIFTMAVGDSPAALRLAACTLEMWGILTEVELQPEVGFATFHYWFPSLGIGVPARTEINGVVKESYDYVGLEW